MPDKPTPVLNPDGTLVGASNTPTKVTNQDGTNIVPAILPVDLTDDANRALGVVKVGNGRSIHTSNRQAAPAAGASLVSIIVIPNTDYDVEILIATPVDTFQLGGGTPYAVIYTLSNEAGLLIPYRFRMNTTSPSLILKCVAGGAGNYFTAITATPV